MGLSEGLEIYFFFLIQGVVSTGVFTFGKKIKLYTNGKFMAQLAFFYKVKRTM